MPRFVLLFKDGTRFRNVFSSNSIGTLNMALEETSLPAFRQACMEACENELACDGIYVQTQSSSYRCKLLNTIDPFDGVGTAHVSESWFRQQVAPSALHDIHAPRM